MVEEVNVEMPEPNNSRRPFSVLDLSAFAWFATCLYLYGGQHAQMACHIACAVPPALFSYAITIDERTTPHGMRAVLYFWFLQGCMFFLDSLMGDLKGFYLAKFVVLSGVFWKATKENTHVFGQRLALPPTVPLRSNHITPRRERMEPGFEQDWPTESTQIGDVRSRHSDYDMNKTFGGLREITAISPHTCSSEYLGEPNSGTMLRMCAGCEDELEALTVITAFSFETFETPLHALHATHSPPLTGTVHLPLPRSRAKLVDTPYTFPVTMAMAPEMSCGDVSLLSTPSIAPGNGELATNPPGYMVLPSTRAIVPLTVINQTNQVMMFALKNNALERIAAAPICGIIPARSIITIRLSVSDCTDIPSLIGERWDKLAIDYTPVSPLFTAFDKATFMASERSRMRLKVVYSVVGSSSSTL